MTETVAAYMGGVGRRSPSEGGNRQTSPGSAWALPFPRAALG